MRRRKKILLLKIGKYAREKAATKKGKWEADEPLRANTDLWESLFEF